MREGYARARMRERERERERGAIVTRGRGCYGRTQRGVSRASQQFTAVPRRFHQFPSLPVGPRATAAQNYTRSRTREINLPPSYLTALVRLPAAGRAKLRTGIIEKLEPERGEGRTVAAGSRGLSRGAPCGVSLRSIRPARARMARKELRIASLSVTT
jgi:hypothetical protein